MPTTLKTVDVKKTVFWNEDLKKHQYRTTFKYYLSGQCACRAIKLEKISDTRPTSGDIASWAWEDFNN